MPGDKKTNAYGNNLGLSFVFCFLLSVFCILAMPAHAQSVLRDTETENFLKQQSLPIFSAAGIAPANIHFILIDENTVNAFVADGQNIFIYSGLILRTENLGELLGVIAHETGHISGGHLIKMNDVYENASRESILLNLLGIAAAAVSGNGSIGSAGSLFSQQSLLGQVLAHSRANEASADEAGLRFLRKSHIPATGMESFMAKLMGQELLPESRQIEYARTHPLTRDRFEAIKQSIQKDSSPPPPLPSDAEEAYQRIKAKLRGYILPRVVEREAAGTDIPSRYARAVARYRLGDMPGALKILDAMQAQEPENPYFHELRGQILFEHGKIREAVSAYQIAADALPDAPLILQSYGQALLANNDTAAAIPVLLRALQNEPNSAGTRRLLATAYGRSGKINEAQLELAEESLLRLDYKSAQHHAKAAKLPPGSPGAIRAADILSITKEKLDKDKNDSERGKGGER